MREIKYTLDGYLLDNPVKLALFIVSCDDELNDWLDTHHKILLLINSLIAMSNNIILAYFNGTIKHIHDTINKLQTKYINYVDIYDIVFSVLNKKSEYQPAYIAIGKKIDYLKTQYLLLKSIWKKALVNIYNLI